MLYTTLGRTGFRVSRMGLGCGGHSRLGLAQGASEEQAAGIVREAIELGVNFIDTAEAYGTESAVGRGIAGTPREQLVLSTKIGATSDTHNTSPAELRTRFEACLERLGTEYVDVLHLHGVRKSEYTYARDQLAPVMHALKAEGKLRAVGITEAFIPDPSHQMLSQAVQDDCWDVVMVGFNMLNQSARRTVLPLTQSREIGTLCMFAVRRALSQPLALRELIGELVAGGLVDPKDLDQNNPLGFLTAAGVASSLQEAAYRYCLWEPGLDVVLSGTGKVEHLQENAKALVGPPLREDILALLARIFERVDSVSGN